MWGVYHIPIKIIWLKEIERKEEQYGLKEKYYNSCKPREKSEKHKEKIRGLFLCIH
jgi:hypothetical protein